MWIFYGWAEALAKYLLTLVKRKLSSSLNRYNTFLLCAALYSM